MDPVLRFDQAFVMGGAALTLALEPAAALAFGGFVAWGGDWPSWSRAYQAGEFQPLPYCFLLGLIGHHFYLDQKIWRPSAQPELLSDLYDSQEAPGLSRAA